MHDRNSVWLLSLYIGNSIDITLITNTKRLLFVFTKEMKTTYANNYSF